MGTNIRMILKACPKCKGDLFLDNDHYGWYWQCLQCSKTLYLEEVKLEKPEAVSSRS